MSDDSEQADARATVWLRAELKTEITDGLGYEDSLSGWLRRAVNDRWLLEQELSNAGIELPEETRPRERLLRDVLHEGLDNYEPEE
jgi:hypothetical protein